MLWVGERVGGRFGGGGWGGGISYNAYRSANVTRAGFDEEFKRGEGHFTYDL